MKRACLAILAAFIFTAPLWLAPATAQQADVCRLTVEVGPPGFYADDQCVDLPADPMSTEDQSLLVYRLRYKVDTAPDWQFTGNATVGEQTFSGLQCGLYDVEAVAYFPGENPDEGCPTAITKETWKPQPGACSLF